jgi:trehalose 6-phosphate phosphatase
MQHLFQVWPDFTDAVKGASHVLLLADYDGTLTPIVARPQEAVLSQEVREKLSALARKPAYSVGIISGRSIDELKKLVSIDGLYYSGNHGLEIEGPGLKYFHPPAEQARATMRELAARLAEEMANIAGVIVQEKGLSLSVHYRLVSGGEEAGVGEAFRRITEPLRREGRISVFSGKKVLEVKPPLDWDKGKAVQIIIRELKGLLKEERILTVFLGDDTTDEDAFRVLHRPDGWSVFIAGEKAVSSADYCLNSVAEVEELLERLITLK